MNKVLALISLFLMLPTQICAQPGYDEERGKLLYEIHCSSCHDTEVHWRKNNLATDWHTLMEQVNRWQSNLSLDWYSKDIADVTGYLNAAYYHFPVLLKDNVSESDQ